MKWSILFLLLSSPGWCLSIGPIQAVTCSNDGSVGTNPWILPANGCGDDGLIASESGTSQYLKATGADLSTIPDAAIIDGIQWEIKKAALPGQDVLDILVNLYINNTITGSNKAQLLTSWPNPTLTYVSYGGATDTWGVSGLHGSDLKTNFGLGLQIQKNGGGTQTGTVDAFRVTVYYHFPILQGYDFDDLF